MVDMYLAQGFWCAGTFGGKVGRGGGNFEGQKGKLGTIEEGPQPDSAAMVAAKKELQELKKKSLAEAKNLKKMKQVGKEAKPRTSNFSKDRHFFWGCPKLEKLQKLSANTLGNA